MSIRFLVSLSAFLAFQPAFPQVKAFEAFLADSAMTNASVSFLVIDADSGRTVAEFNSGKSLIPASVMKLVTTAAAIEILGPDYTFKTLVGYSGELNDRTGLLKGNIIIKGGGDPALGSVQFGDYYTGFETKWTDEIKKAGIRKIKGKIITDDTRYDYQPVPGKWLWEDAGNYYGAGVYGLSVYDNTYEIHFKTSSDSSVHQVTGIIPEECDYGLTDMLVVSGSEDEGYIYAAPYSQGGWMAGAIPSDKEDFVLKASVPDPPLLLAEMLDKKLRSEGIEISGAPSTLRLGAEPGEELEPLCKTISPPLKDIIIVLNHESMNLYAEHILKEMGKVHKNDGSLLSGTQAIAEFMHITGIPANGFFQEDGSGLSPLNAVSAKAIVDLLRYMKVKSRYSSEFFSSLPEGGKEGTLKNYFRDPLFESRLSAKSGSMTRVRSYAGYLTTASDKELIFCIIVNNFTGPSREIVAHIEEVFKEIIITN